MAERDPARVVSALPSPFKPMLAHDKLAPPWGKPGWVYEEKVDGYRTIAYKQANAVALVSRNMRNLMPRFRNVGIAIAELEAPELILDGEIARFDQDLVSHLLYMRNEDGAVVTDPVFVAFDCLFARGRDLRGEPLRERRRVLERELDGAEGPIMLARRLDADWREAWEEVKRKGYEGLIAKEESSIYQPGKRSNAWIKVKHRIRQGWPEEKSSAAAVDFLWTVAGLDVRRRAGYARSVKPLSLGELRRRFVDRGRPLPLEIERALEADERPGARQILSQVRRRRRDRRAEGQRLRGILRFERELWQRGLTLLAGVDEAGMSPLAGPVAAAAVVLDVETRLVGVDDSKKLSPKARDELALEIKARARAWAVAFAEPSEIDSINIYWAGLLAMQRAVEGLGLVPDHLLIDARRLRELAIPQSAIVKGDEKSASIAAASILAKTARDALMIEADRQFPGYGFAQHKGYPVRAHRVALARLGPCPLHRRSFALVSEALKRASNGVGKSKSAQSERARVRSE